MVTQTQHLDRRSAPGGLRDHSTLRSGTGFVPERRIVRRAGDLHPRSRPESRSCWRAARTRARGHAAATGGRWRRYRLPRTRGDGPAELARPSAADSASPHTRGWTRSRSPGDLRNQGFPAHAGMDPARRTTRTEPVGLPRTRGDGPRPAASWKRAGWASPHTRGWTPASPHTRGWTAEIAPGTGRRPGFPAHAGMDPPRCRRSAGRARLHVRERARRGARRPRSRPLVPPRGRTGKRHRAEQPSASCTRTGAACVVIAWKPYAGTAWPPNRGIRSCRRRSTACGETSGLGPIFGTIHQGIDLDTTAGLSPDHALALARAPSGRRAGDRRSTGTRDLPDRSRRVRPRLPRGADGRPDGGSPGSRARGPVGAGGMTWRCRFGFW